jgi:transportin-1
MIQSDTLNAHINDYLTRLFQLANDTDPDVQRELCRALSLLLDSHMDMLEPHLGNIVEFMLMRSQVGD